MKKHFDLQPEETARIIETLVLFPLRRLIFALGAILVGLVCKRPYSGLWLARYFLGIGGTTRLPRKFEERIIATLSQSPAKKYYDSYYRQHIIGCNQNKETAAWFAEAEYAKIGASVLQYQADSVSDFYTTVGSFLLIPQNGSLKTATVFEYVDVYDWHPGAGWSFGLNIAGLPFSLCVQGEDDFWLNLKFGKEFVTRGIITIPGTEERHA